MRPRPVSLSAAFGGPVRAAAREGLVQAVAGQRRAAQRGRTARRPGRGCRPEASLQTPGRTRGPGPAGSRRPWPGAGGAPRRRPGRPAAARRRARTARLIHRSLVASDVPTSNHASQHSMVPMTASSRIRTCRSRQMAQAVAGEGSEQEDVEVHPDRAPVVRVEVARQGGGEDHDPARQDHAADGRDEQRQPALTAQLRVGQVRVGQRARVLGWLAAGVRAVEFGEKPRPGDAVRLRSSGGVQPRLSHSHCASGRE